MATQKARGRGCETMVLAVASLCEAPAAAEAAPYDCEPGHLQPRLRSSRKRRAFAKGRRFSDMATQVEFYDLAAGHRRSAHLGKPGRAGFAACGPRLRPPARSCFRPHPVSKRFPSLPTCAVSPPLTNPHPC